eukprot:Rhum_TRINITY_DN14321_c20_g1::Rhum_TRINITY_DN14321_c20_g1_i1::g.81508::m.81508
MVLALAAMQAADCDTAGHTMEPSHARASPVSSAKAKRVTAKKKAGRRKAAPRGDPLPAPAQHLDPLESPLSSGRTPDRIVLTPLPGRGTGVGGGGGKLAFNPHCSPHPHQPTAFPSHHSGGSNSSCSVGCQVSPPPTPPTTALALPWWLTVNDEWYLAQVTARYEDELQLNNPRHRSNRAPLRYVASVERRPVAAFVPATAPHWARPLLSGEYDHCFMTWDTITVKALMSEGSESKSRIVVWDTDGLPVRMLTPGRRANADAFTEGASSTTVRAVPPGQGPVKCRLVFDSGDVCVHRHSKDCGFCYSIDSGEGPALLQVPLPCNISSPTTPGSTTPAAHTGVVAALVVLTWASGEQLEAAIIVGAGGAQPLLSAAMGDEEGDVSSGENDTDSSSTDLDDSDDGDSDDEDASSSSDSTDSSSDSCDDLFGPVKRVGAATASAPIRFAKAEDACGGVDNSNNSDGFGDLRSYVRDSFEALDDLDAAWSDEEEEESGEDKGHGGGADAAKDYPELYSLGFSDLTVS